MSRGSEYASNVARILQNQAAAAGNAKLASGQAWGQAFATLGDIAGNLPMQILQARQQDRQVKEEQELRALFSTDKTPTASEIFRLVGPERGARIVNGMAALQTDVTGDYDKQQKVLANVMIGMHSLPESVRAEAYPGVRGNLIQRGVIKAEDAPETYDPNWWQQTISYGQQPKEPTPAQLPAMGSFEDYVGRKFGPNPTAEQIEQARQSWARSDDAPASASGATVGSFEDYVLRTYGPQATPQQVLKARQEWARSDDAPQGSGGSEPLMAVMGPDGKPVYMRRSQAEGMQPASSREQGRAVTSGDANRIKDFTSGLDDVQVIKTLLQPGTTGAGPALGAWIPNFVTEWTGWGSDAKSTQAVIDRVKQVIGKTLEEGVLRKEDEIKYEKILPTIRDPHEVVVTKIAGLEQAIALERERQLEALADAGYDTSRFQERIGGGSSTGPRVGERRTINGQLAEWDGRGWLPVSR